MKGAGRWWLGGLVLLMSGMVQTVEAGRAWYRGPYPYFLYAGVEQYDWQEFSGSGTTLDRESGPLLTVGGGVSNLRQATHGLVYRAGIRLYGGTIDYDGQTLGGTPLTTHSDYTGATVAGLAGLRFGRQQRGIDLFAGGGLDSWLRSLRDARTVNGTPAYGYSEQYDILYGELGAGLFGNYGSWSWRIRAGGKYPLYTFEHVNLGDGFNLFPGRELSGFARASLEFGPPDRPHLGLSASYDSFRFSASSPELLTFSGTPDGYYIQPRSHQDIYGISATYYFR